MIKIYVAAKWGRREDAASTARDLRAAGFLIVSSWHDGPEDWEGVPTPEQMRTIAVKDYVEVTTCDIVLSLTEEPGALQKYGSRHVEFGMGYALGKVCILLGPRELMFHHLPEVRRFDTIDDFILSYDTKALIDGHF